MEGFKLQGSPRFLDWIVVCMVIGMVACRLYTLSEFNSCAVIIVLLPAWALVIHFRREFLSILVSSIILTSLGYVLMSGALDSSCEAKLDYFNGRLCRIEGKVSGFPGGFRDGQTVRIDCYKVQEGDRIVRVNQFIRLWIYGAQWNDISPGDTVRAEVCLKKQRGKRFPGDYDRRVYLAGEGVYYTASIEMGPRLMVIKNRIPAYLMPAATFRNRTAALLSKAGQPADGLLHALLLGRRDRLEASVEESFRRSGMAHILAVSGLHVGLVGLLFYASSVFLLRQINFLTSRLDVRRVAALFSIAPIIFYTMVTGSKAPAVRACVMAVIFLVGTVLERCSDQFNSLSLAALIILLYSPPALFSPSFQLSFMAAYSILKVAFEFPRFLSEQAGGIRRIIFRRVLRFLLISSAAFLGTLPLAAYHFSLVAPAGIVAGLIAIPVCACAIIPFGLAGSFAAQFSSSAAIVIMQPAVWGSRIIIYLAQGIARNPHLYFEFFHPSPAQVAGLYIIAFSLLSFKKRLGQACFAAGLSWFVIASLLVSPVSGNHQFKATYLNVGHGDATLIELPEGQRFLVDAGGRSDTYDRGCSVVTPFLRAKRIRSLDALIISHAHNDHAGGAQSVLKEIPAGEILHPCRPESDQPAGLIYSGEGFPRRTKKEGDRVACGSYSLIFWSPATGTESIYQMGPEAEINDNSLVFTCIGPEGTLLFAGDAGKTVLDDLSAKYSSALRACVLKVPHHGSIKSWSEEFNRAVRPKVAIIPAGRNPFGHPDGAVVDGLRDMGAEVYLTGIDGTIECILNKGQVEIAIWDDKYNGISPKGLWNWFFVGY